ncbi:hypothetical protein ACVWYF_004145 [Hymenobacter sp. UYAg731]
MKSENSTIAPADAERGEVQLTISGESRLIRFGMRFIKTLTDQKGEAGPGDILERIASGTGAALAAMVDMAVLGVQLATPGLSADEALTIVDELSKAEQEELFSVAFRAVTKSPLLAALNRG